MSNIFEKIDNLEKEILNTEEYKYYKKVSTKLNNNEFIMNLIEDIKILQKLLVNAKYKKLDYNSIENEYNEKLKILEDIPLYNQYKDSIENLNNIFINITNIIESSINM
ncbi:MAG: YlbF family regulator [Bacilli bacterium]